MEILLLNTSHSSSYHVLLLYRAAYNDTSSLRRVTYFQGQVVGSYTGYRTCNVTLLVCPLRH